MKKKKYIWSVDKKTKRICDQIGCNKVGEYIAPKKPNSKEKYFFCLHHVKLYNKRWDYFAGMSQSEIYKFQSEDALSLKPTRPLSDSVNTKIKFNFGFNFDGIFNYSAKDKKQKKSHSNEFDDALSLFKIKPPFSSEKLKKQYNFLVKENHPDINGNNPEKEKLLKKINNYYKVLRKIAK